MPTDTKQVDTNDVIARLKAMHEFSEDHPEEWRNEIAKDLNELIRHGIWLRTARKRTSIYAAAVLRIVERVSEFDEISRKGKERE